MNLQLSTPPSLLRLFRCLTVLLLLIPFSLSAFQFDLLFSEEDLPRIRDNARHPEFADFWKDYREALPRGDMDFHREAFVYLVDGDRDRIQPAIEGMMAMVRRDRWHEFQDADGTPVGFLRCAARTANVAMVYDWLYEELTPAQQKETATAIAEKGCQPLYTALKGMRYPETVLEWQFVPAALKEFTPRDMRRWPEILSKNNFRAVIDGGLALGLFAVREDPRADAWEEMLTDGIPRFNELFKDDGSYDEAVTYVNYAMKYQILAMEVMKRKRGIDYFDTANFTGLIDFVLAMYLPSHADPYGSVSFGDAGPSLQSNTAFWIAANSRDGLAQYLGSHYAEHYWSSLLFFDPTIFPEAPRGGFELIETDLDWIIARTGYNAEDMVLAMRSGEPMNHEHADRNALQFKAFGEILWSDPGKVTYDNRTPEWILRTSQGHNMVLINGKGIQYHQGEEGTNAGLSEAKIVRSGMRQDYAFWASDATHGYQLVNPAVQSVTRTVIFSPEVPVVLVADKIIATEPCRVATRWHVQSPDKLGTVSLSERNYALLGRPYADLHMWIGGTHAPDFQEGALEFPESDKRYRYVDATNSAKSGSTLLITVGVPSHKNKPVPEVQIQQVSENLWQVSIHVNGQQFSAELIDNGILPEFSVRLAPAK
jgi:hypothetical protein